MAVGRGLATKIDVRNVRGVVANLFAADKRVQRGVRELVADTAGRQYQRTADLTPKDTFFSVEHLRLDFTPDHLGYTVGWRAEDYEAAGLAFYAPYFVFGTSTSPAQDPLTPAQREADGYMRTRLGRIVRTAIARKAVGA